MNSAPATPHLLTPEWQPGQLEDNTLGQGPDIWLLPLDQITPDPGLLSPAERARADGLAMAEARRAMLALRTAQRRILASYLNTPAAGLVFVTAAKGKPALADHSLRFNLSHSQGLATLVVSRAEVGIDLEWPRPVPHLTAIAKRLFDTETLHTLESLQGPQQLAACRTWIVESEHRPQRAQFLPDLQPNSPAIRQKYGEKCAAAVDLQPTTSKSDRLLAAFTRAWVCLEARQKLSGEGLFGERHLIAHQLWLYQLEDGGYLALAQAGTQSPEPRLWRLQNP